MLIYITSARFIFSLFCVCFGAYVPSSGSLYIVFAKVINF